MSFSNRQDLFEEEKAYIPLNPDRSPSNRTRSATLMPPSLHHGPPFAPLPPPPQSGFIAPVYFHRDQLPSPGPHPTYYSQQRGNHPNRRSGSHHQYNNQPFRQPQYPPQPPQFIEPYPAMFPLQIPQIVDTRSLIRAVQIDPDRAFEAYRNLMQERDTLRREVQILAENTAAIRADFNAARINYEKLLEIWMQKQVLMWKYVERIKNGEEAEIELTDTGERVMPGREYYTGGDEVNIALTTDDVHDLWTGKWVAKDPVLRTGSEDATEERGRSDRSVKFSPVKATSKALNLAIETAESVCESTSATYESSDILGMKLDPSARPFIPSPARSSSRSLGPSSASNSIYQPRSGTPAPADPNTPAMARDNPIVKPAIPLSFRDALTKPFHANPIASGYDQQQDGRHMQGGGSKSVPNRGGHTFEPSRHDSESNDVIEETTLNKSQRSKQRKQVWRRRQLEQDSKSPVSVPTEQKSPFPERKVSLEVVKVSNLPAYPQAQPFQSSQHRSSGLADSLNAFPELTQKREIPTGPSLSPGENRNSRARSAGFMSRARLQATLQSILPPYDKICPFSLLYQSGCWVRGCELLHVCATFNSVDVDENAEDQYQFPPLGSEPSKSGSAVSRCMHEDGELVLQGQICSQGIHLHRSCKEEIKGNSCRFWGKVAPTPEREKERGGGGNAKKFEKLELEHNYFRAPALFQSPSDPGADATPAPPQTPVREDSTDRNEQSHPTPAEAASASSNQPKHKVKESELKQKANETDLKQKGKEIEPKENSKEIEREMHFKSLVHERDGIGRDAWNARVLNASLRDAHKCGLWGVDITVDFGLKAESEAGSIEWKGNDSKSADASRGGGRGGLTWRLGTESPRRIKAKWRDS